MRKLKPEQINRCVLGALEEAGVEGLPADWRSLPDDQRVEARFDAGRLTSRSKDELIHAVRARLRSAGAYCHIEPAHLDQTATVRDLIAFVRSHHQPIP